MVNQIIKQEKLIPVKYHGKVKYIVFECNYCHKEFVKPNSYYRKQLKTRKKACCFCSPKCRLAFQSEKGNFQSPSKTEQKVKNVKKKDSNGKKKNPVTSFLKNLFFTKPQN